MGTRKLVEGGQAVEIKQGSPENFYKEMRKDTRTPLEKFKHYPLTWSQIASFRRSKTQWYSLYVKGKRGHSTKEMIYGNIVGDRLAVDPTFMPQIPRLAHFEYVTECKIGKVKLRAHIDNYETGKLAEFKTGKEPWDQKRVDYHEQIDLYCAQLYLADKVKPESLDINLYWMPTVDRTEPDGEGGYDTFVEVTGEVHVFPVKKTMKDVLKVLAMAQGVRKEMQAYVLAH